MPRTQLIQHRGGTAAQWTSANPVLALREKGVETDTLKEKLGDGVTAWNSLAYFNQGGGGGGTVSDATTTTKGVVQLAGDLGGTAASPSVKSRSITKTVGTAGSGADYVTDGTADDAEIQAAINAVASLGGGVVLIRVGTYRISNTLTFPFDARVTLRGERMARTPTGGVTLKTSASVNLTSLISFSGNANPTTNADLTHDINFEFITLDGNGTTANGITMTNQDTSKLYDCRIVACVNAIVTVWNSTADPIPATIPGGLYVDRCNISSNGGIGIDLQYQTQCWISNSWFTGSSVTTWIRLNGSNKIKMSNNEFNTATQALLFNDTATFPTNDITGASLVFNVGTGNAAWTDTRVNVSSDRVALRGITWPTGVVINQLVGQHNNIDEYPELITIANAAQKGLVIKGAPAQSGRYFEAQNSAGTNVAYLNSGGNWYVNNGSNSTVSYGFTAEINTGMYRVGAGSLGWSILGTLALNLTATTLDVLSKKIINVTDPTNAQDAATKNYVDTRPSSSVMTQQTAPTVATGTALQWTASGSGTKDGTAYDQGDVLITSNVGGTSKTLMILDWSTL